MISFILLRGLDGVEGVASHGGQISLTLFLVECLTGWRCETGEDMVTGGWEGEGGC